MSKPVFVFVPGAWHGPEAFEPVANQLQAKGYTSEYISLKSVGASPPLNGFEPDVELIKSTISKLTNEGKNVVLVMHSYGGAPAQQAVGELLKEGYSGEGKVVMMAWVTAFALSEGASLIKMLGGNPLPWFEISEDEKVVGAANARDIFYNEVSESEATKWVGRLKPHSYRTMFSEVTYEPWMEVPSAYLVCEKDQAIPYQAQEGMIAAVQGKNPKAFAIVDKIPSDHSPFLSMPEKMTEFLLKCAQ